MVTPLEALTAVLLTVMLIAAGLLILPRVLVSIRWHKPIEYLPYPPPEHWAEIVRANVPITKELAGADFERLLKLILVFLDEKNVEGAGGLELTEEIEVTVAAQACLLLIWRNTGMFPGLKTVIVYPDAVIPKYAEHFGSNLTIVPDDRRAVLGQSWAKGVVILSWDSTKHGAFDPGDGHNVVMHEFAHQLDQETGSADGLPVGLPLSAIKPWAAVMEKRFRQLKSATRKGRRSVLRSYGATNRAEFFAVATEAFFEKPDQLRTRKPDLYELLAEFYGVDPAEGMRRWEPVAESAETPA